MTLFSKLLPYLTITALAFALSCNRKDPAPDCGCEGHAYKHLENAEASYLGHGGFILFDTKDTAFKIWASACEIDSSWQKSEKIGEILSRDYILSGDFKSACFMGPTLVAVPPFIQVTSIKKK
ncbi:hypothetical protein [Dyadobacter pollutisoli]|jgi:hypothetical protein|uniref:Lipoprotein n=1 Tax=Dyadobacter pollutisoli TaxID=2910158 RepID=A0A9E8SND5_9BACT|nr:hypothetical protein [Dyadobacter pollutisoli]WAC14204.1 hypothetical protein ON006_09640 [Dyadobacter pollutisoli]